jgi:diaminopimelate epimerase
MKFIKMNGAGNDFVIFDARKQAVELSPEQIKNISDRKNIGCDQLIIIKNPSTPPLRGEDVLTQRQSATNEVDVEMIIYNSDGSVSGACGNATRCVASLLEGAEVKIKTAAGILECKKNGDLISVNMGIPRFNWDAIPLAKNIDTQKVLLEGFEFACLNIGNPHAVTFISAPLEDSKFFTSGPKIETNPLFPQKTNVEFAQIISDYLINVRVWERGAGETLACGSGACAVGILAIKHRLVKNNKVTTRFKGGDLIIEWNGEGSAVIMTGSYEKEFEGNYEL